MNQTIEQLLSHRSVRHFKKASVNGQAETTVNYCSSSRIKLQFFTSLYNYRNQRS